MGIRYIKIYKKHIYDGSCILDIPHIPLFQPCYGAFPPPGRLRPRSVVLGRVGLVRAGSLHAALPLQFRNWGSYYSNAV